MAVIGFTGKKGVGKSTAAAVCVLAGFERMSFAATLKRMARVLLVSMGIDNVDLLALPQNKERVIPGLGCTYRHLLQTLGTEWGRAIHPDLWVMDVRNQLNEMGPGDFVFDDVRFENEAAMIRELGGVIIHIARFGQDDTDTHASEAGIEKMPGDVVMINDNDLAAFQDAVLATLGAISDEAASVAVVEGF